MNAQALALESPLLSDKEQLNAPPGWTKKLVPTKVKGFTPKKYDIIFIAPDGQEVHSKWHLRRYLKAHPDGPAISEFIWSSGDETPVRRSSGDETPVRRSARFAMREYKENEESTPKKQGKRNAAEIDGEVTGDDQAKTPPRKRAKKGGNSSGSVDKGAAQDAVDGTGKDEEMHDVQDKTTMFGDGVTQDETLNGGLHINEGRDKQASKETATEKLVVEAPSDEKQVEDVSLTPLEENTVSEAMEQSEPAVTESAADGVEQHEVELKVLAETDTSAIPSGEVKDNKISMEAWEPSGCIDGLKFVEWGDEKDVSDPCLINSDKVTVEAPVLQELLEGNDKIFKPLIQKEEEQERLLNCHNSPLRVEQGQEKKTSGESNYSPAPASVAN